jgi:hypothetical protein
MIPPSTRRTVSSSISSLTSFTKAGLSFSGKALWIISTSAFLIGVPWALAYAEEEQYIQMEREQGMIRGANEVCFDVIFCCYTFLSSSFACSSTRIQPSGCSGKIGEGMENFFVRRQCLYGLVFTRLLSHKRYQNRR